MNPFEQPKGTPGWVKFTGSITVVFVGFLIAALMITQPSCTHYPPTDVHLEPDRLRNHVIMLSEELAPRNYKHYRNLEKTAAYVSNHLAQAGGKLSEQMYAVKGRNYRNVIAVFGPETQSRIIVGAHYDTYQDTPGADDNASGVAGLIELAYLLGNIELEQQVELVAYTLEEPPFFRTGDMGSARHAYRLKQNDVEVEAMICLEMIGYFSDEEGSQRFPSTVLRIIYPDTGSFIAVAGRFSDRKLVKLVKNSMRGATDLPVHSICAPEGVAGIDFSDHRNYWNNDYTAVMITDTAFFRNHHYHATSDTADRLDYYRMSKVILGVYEAIVRLSNDEG